MPLSPHLAEIAEQSTWLEPLTPAEQAAVLGAANMRTYQRGEGLFRQGDQPAGIHLLLTGQVRTWSHDPVGNVVTLKLLNAGELVGCIAAWSRRPQPASAAAATRVDALFWPTPSLDDLQRLYPALAASSLAVLGDRAIRLMDRLVTVSTAPAAERIAAALLDLSEGRTGSISISRQGLADLTATTMHTVSRTISAWHRRGLLVGGRSRIDLLDPAAIAREAPTATRGALETRAI